MEFTDEYDVEKLQQQLNQPQDANSIVGLNIGAIKARSSITPPTVNQPAPTPQANTDNMVYAPTPSTPNVAPTMPLTPPPISQEAIQASVQAAAQAEQMANNQEQQRQTIANKSALEDKLEDIADKLIANALFTDELSSSHRVNLIETLSPKLFKGPNYILMSMLYLLRNKGANRQSVTISAEYINIALSQQKKLLMEAEEQGYIDLSMVSDTTNKYAAFANEVQKHYNDLYCNTMESIIDKNEYSLLIEEFKHLYCTYSVGKSLDKAKEILFNTIKEGRNVLSGYEDATSLIRTTINKTDTLAHPDEGEGFIHASDLSIFNNNNQPQKLADFDLLPTLNKEDHIGGIYTDMFYNILAPTKNGKSRFTARMAHSVLLNGHDIVVWPHEGGYGMWYAQILVCHTEYLARLRGETMSGKMIDQKKLYYNTFAPNEVGLKKKVQLAEYDLTKSGKYGKIVFIDKPFVVEELTDTILNAMKENGNNTKLVLIDYLQLIDSNTRGMQKPQYIGKAYQQMLAFAKKHHCAVVSPSQVTQDFMKQISMSKDGDVPELRTAGGESSEIIRTPDFNLMLYATKEMLEKGEMKIISVPSRLSRVFETLNITTDLGVCRFFEVNNKVSNNNGGNSNNANVGNQNQYWEDEEDE